MPTSRTIGEQKLRKACDACNLSKVRCSRGRPSCDRCVLQGLKCIYGISMRSGKHPAASSNITKPKRQSLPSPSPSPSSTESPSSAYSSDRRTQSIDSSVYSLTDSMLLGADPSSALADNPYYFETSMALGTSSLKQQPNIQDSFFDTGFLDHQSTFYINPSDLIKTDPPPTTNTSPDSESSCFYSSTTSSSPTSPSSTQHSPTSTTSTGSSPNTTCACLHNMTRQTLSMSPITTQTTPTTHPNPTLPQAKSALKVCHAVLACPDHPTTDIPLTLTLAALITKIIEAYDGLRGQLRWDEYQIEFANVIALVRAFEGTKGCDGGAGNSRGGGGGYVDGFGGEGKGGRASDCEGKICRDLVAFLQRRVQGSL